MTTSRQRVNPLCFIALGVGAGACSSQPSAPTDRVAIGVAPLDLPGLSDACYRLTVTNADAETVWRREGVCASDHGDGESAITYVGPCDASSVDGEPQINTVIVEIEDLFAADGPVARTSYQNPCGHTDNGNFDGFSPCALAFVCEPNRDVPVEFNLTVMRDASQGFFDIAVGFEDVFCAAKLDCSYADGRPIELLSPPEGGARGQTAVLAVACSGGEGGGAPGTALFYDRVVVTCDGQSVVLDPTAGPGNAWGGDVADPDPGDAVWQYAVYRGVEDGGGCEGCGVVYWNVAVGFDPDADCDVETHITAADAASGAPSWESFATPERAAYPVIDVYAQLSAGGQVCAQNPLNGEGSGVYTSYTAVEEPRSFCHRFDGADVATADGCGGGSGAECVHVAIEDVSSGLEITGVQTTARGQTFTALGSGTLQQLQLPLRHHQGVWTSPVTVSLFAAANGLPTGNALGGAVIAAGDIGTSLAYVSVDLGPVPIVAGQTYAVVLSTTGSARYVWGASSNDSYPDGAAFSGTNLLAVWDYALRADYCATGP